MEKRAIFSFPLDLSPRRLLPRKHVVVSLDRELNIASPALIESLLPSAVMKVP